MKNSIYWRDLFKPRYAIVIELHRFPQLLTDGPGSIELKTVLYPVIMRLPYKRPLSMPFNQFYNQLMFSMGSQTKIFCGTKRTLSKLYGIGSCSKENINNAILFKPKEYRTVGTAFN